MAAAPQPPNPRTEPSAGESLTAWFAEIGERFSRLEAQEVTLNLAISAAIAVGAVGLILLAGVVMRMAWRRLAARDLAPHMPPGARRPHAIRMTWFLLRAIVAVTALMMILGVWGVDPLGWLRGEETSAILLRLSLIVLIVTAVDEIINIVVERILHRVQRRTSDRRRAAQLATLEPLIQGLVHVVLIVLAVMTILSEIGVQIGPLLAGAGVVGIAVGFGAQTLVKDFLTGVFLLVEDIVSVGDVVRIGESSGLVEQMTLRTIRLRDFDGTLHILPYGEAQVIHNMTKTFSFYVFELQVSYAADIDQAVGIMREVGAQLRSEEPYASVILEPLEVVGVERLADSGVVLKARFKTLPREQWTVGREYNKRIKVAFDAAGIEIPFPHMKLVLPENPEDRS